jgi:C4-dicarboxylate transporter DctM subunit
MAGSSRRSGLARRARSESPLSSEPAVEQPEPGSPPYEADDRTETPTGEAYSRAALVAAAAGGRVESAANDETAAAEVTSAGAAPGEVTDGAASSPPPWEVTVGNRLSQGLVWLTGLLMVAAVVVIVIEIIYRYVLREPFESSEDLQGLLFTWIVFLSLPRAIWLDSTPRIGVTRYFGPRLREAARVTQIGATFGFFVVVLLSYWKLEPSVSATEIASLNISQNVDGVAVAVGTILMAVVLGLRCWRELLGWRLLGMLAAAAATVLIVTQVGQSVTVGLIVLAVLMILDAPIAVALGLAGCTLVIGGNWAQASVPAGQLLQPMQNLALLAIPLFLLMGGFVASTRLAGDLSRLVQAALGWIPGGSALACVITGAIFANISGSAIADTAAIGSIYIPEMKRQGYPPEEAAALQAAAGVVGVVFPPAIAMILFASVAQINVVPVFEAVIIPGLLIVLGQAVVTLRRARRIPEVAAHTQPFSIMEVLRSLPRASIVLLIPIILDVGILSGVFTPAESGAVAIVVTIVLLAVSAPRDLRSLGRGFEAAVNNTSTVMFILISVSIINYGFSVSNVGTSIDSLLGSVTTHPLLLLLVINLIFAIVHEFVDAGPTILVLVPLILPAVTMAHVSLLQLAAVIAINSTIGAILPPVGVSLYVSAGIAGVSPGRLMRPIVSYVLSSVVVLVLVTVFPQISTWLPGLMK